MRVELHLLARLERLPRTDCPLMLATYRTLTQLDPERMAPGYHPVGIRPNSAGLDRGRKLTTATAFWVPLQT